MFIYFENVDSVICPVICDKRLSDNLLSYDVNNKKSKQIIISLLTKYKNLFIIRGEVDDVSLELSKNHFEEKKNYLYINRSYLSFWINNLSELNDYSTESLLLSI